MVRGTISIAIALLVSAPVAQANRPPTAGERVAIARPLHIPAACAVIRVSSISPRFAIFRGSTTSRSCRRYASNGVSVLHRSPRGWRIVVAGSDSFCPARGVPKTVLVDLHACSTWKVQRPEARDAGLEEARTVAADAAARMSAAAPVPRVVSCERPDDLYAYDCDIEFSFTAPGISCTPLFAHVTADWRDELHVETLPPEPYCAYSDG